MASSSPNMRITNYIVDTNPFQLAGPPDWFLRQLWEFDNSLVLVPSRQGFFYRLGQRRPLKLPERMVNDILKEHADTQMLASYSLVPVTTVLATANWSNPVFFEELRRRAPWRWGGADKFEKMVEEQDLREAIDKKAKIDDRNTYLAKDSWRYYNKLIGTRSHLWSPTTKTDKAPTVSANLILPSSIKSYKPAVTATWLDRLGD